MKIIIIILNVFIIIFLISCKSKRNNNYNIKKESDSYYDDVISISEPAKDVVITCHDKEGKEKEIKLRTYINIIEKYYADIKEEKYYKEYVDWANYYGIDITRIKNTKRMAYRIIYLWECNPISDVIGKPSLIELFIKKSITGLAIMYVREEYWDKSLECNITDLEIVCLYD